IIGDPITVADGVVILPVSKVSFGYASGGSDLPAKTTDLFGGATGGGVTIQPLAFLVITKDGVELLQLQTAENTGDRIVNAVPGLVDKLLSLVKKDKKQENEDADTASK
ncbi:MAG TPA: sporulation protein YtfJ, partial [Clostridiales bacterium]|nr:sporulation protein YtfJ [Clostridiales bacterium]